MRRVPRCWEDANARHDLLLSTHKIEPVGLGEWNEVVGEIASRRALVGVRRILVLATLHDVARIGESGPHRTRVVAKRIPAGVIEVQMRVDHERYVSRRNTQRA